MKIGAILAEYITAIMEEADAKHFLVAHVGDTLCAIPLTQVVETMRLRPFDVWTEGTDFVLGVALVRGNATPVVDLRRVFGEPAPAHPERWVVVRLAQGQAVLGVDQILDIVSQEQLQPEELPPLLEEMEDVVERIGQRDSSLLAILRLSRLIPESVWHKVDLPT